LFCALASINCIFLPFHLSSFCLLFRLFPHRPQDFFFFSLFLPSCFFSITSIMKFYSLSWNTANDRSERTRKKEGRKAVVVVVAILIVRIYLDRLFSSSKTNSCNNHTNRKLIIFSKNFISYSRSFMELNFKKIQYKIICISNLNNRGIGFFSIFKSLIIALT
jgi:hypothetical protein